MKPDGGDAFVAGFILGACVCGFMLTWLFNSPPVRTFQKDAVKAGVAEFYATPEGNVLFRWKQTTGTLAHKVLD